MRKAAFYSIHRRLQPLLYSGHADFFVKRSPDKRESLHELCKLMEPSVKARGGLSTTFCIWGKILGGASTISCRGFLSIKSRRLKWRKSFFELYASRVKDGCKYVSTWRERRWGFAKKRILYKKAPIRSKDAVDAFAHFLPSVGKCGKRKNSAREACNTIGGQNPLDEPPPPKPPPPPEKPPPPPEKPPEKPPP